MAQLGAQAPVIPLTRLDDADADLLAELLDTVRRVAATAQFTLGEQVESFEAEFAGYCGTPHAVGVSSGTEALTLTLRALEVGPGDDVVVPANSFIATAEAVTLAGATPRFADVDPGTALLTVETARAALTPRTRCIIPVHLYGRTVELQPIMRLARERGLVVIEDACQAHGAQMSARRAGAVGDAGCFSFYPAKNLGAWGDGGAVVTASAGIADRVRLLRSHGERQRYHHELPGTTARLDALQAAILRVKLRRLDDWNAARRRVSTALAEALRDSGVTVPPPPRPGGDDVVHQFVVCTPERDRLRQHLADRGIAGAIHYPVPIHRTPAYADTVRLPVAEALADQILSLPMHPRLTEEEIGRIADAVAEFGDSRA